MQKSFIHLLTFVSRFYCVKTDIVEDKYLKIIGGKEENWGQLKITEIW